MQGHYSISLIDPKDLLPFQIKKKAGIKNKLVEKIRGKKELNTVIEKIKKSKLQIVYLGEDEENERHIERFLLQDGYMEVIMESPVSITANFIEKKTAQKYSTALKKTFQKSMPDSDFKELFIDSIIVEKKQPLSRETWNSMRSIYLQKSAIFLAVVAFIVLIFEVVKILIEEASYILLAHSDYGHVMRVVAIIIAAIIVTFFHENIKQKIEGLIEKIIR